MKKLSNDELLDYLKQANRYFTFEPQEKDKQAYQQIRQLIEAQEPSEKELEEFVRIWALVWGHFSDRQKKIVTEYIVRLLDAYDKLRRG